MWHSSTLFNDCLEGRKCFNNKLNTSFIYGYMASNILLWPHEWWQKKPDMSLTKLRHCVNIHVVWRKDGFYLMMHSTHFILWLNGIKTRVRTKFCWHHFVSYSFLLTIEIFYMHYPTNSIVYTIAIVSSLVDHWLEQKIAQWFRQVWLLYHRSTSFSLWQIGFYGKQNYSLITHCTLFN